MLANLLFGTKMRRAAPAAADLWRTQGGSQGVLVWLSLGGGEGYKAEGWPATHRESATVVSTQCEPERVAALRAPRLRLTVGGHVIVLIFFAQPAIHSS